jgi:carbon storage regulator
MLVLSRQEGESVMIETDIQVTVLNLKNGSVSLQFSAPKEVSIWRHELGIKTVREVSGYGKLILSRAVDQSVYIGPEVTLTVNGIIHSKVVRLGFEAPRRVHIHRLEIYDKILSEKRSILQPGAEAYWAELDNENIALYKGYIGAWVDSPQASNVTLVGVRFVKLQPGTAFPQGPANWQTCSQSEQTVCSLDLHPTSENAIKRGQRLVSDR